MPRSIILDVDTGTDDAIAIMMAALSPEIDLVACTTVWGNRPVEDTTDNTLRVLDYINRSDIPVYRGLDEPFGPIVVPQPNPSDDHSGGKMHPKELDLPPASSVAQTQGAVEWLVETLRARTEPITLVPVGPLTNIAAAITLDPSIIDKVDEIVIMGGAHAFGNATPSAESNIWHDPVAADVVFKAGFERIVLVPLDSTHDALVTGAQASELQALGTPAGLATAICIQQRIVAHDESQPQAIPDSAPIHDAVCIAYLLDPAVIPLNHLHVGIETTGVRTFGRTVIDVRHRGMEEPNAFVALTADADVFYRLLKECVSIQR
ncbi:nucleoside hydrolase [Salinibacterium amurskyense]|uniref:nucleoside hydrolase n=1 Tax=Salinibacterium amurskyense TaxID=205941 RepID=UPI003120494B